MKKHIPTLSVVICTKNRATDLSECLLSLSAQRIRPQELIIIDNHSTDTTADVIGAFQKRASYPVRHIIEKKSGYPVIYNRGLKEAKSDWIIFIDDDCVAAKNWYISVWQTIRQNPSAACVVGPYHTFHKKNVFSLATEFHQYYWILENL